MKQLVNFIPGTVQECKVLLKAISEAGDEGLVLPDRYGKAENLSKEESKELASLVISQIGEHNASECKEPDGHSIETDRGILFWLGNDESVKKGIEVFVDDESSEGLIAAPDGEYTTEKGTIIAVLEGVVVSVTATKKSSNKKSTK